LAVEIPGDAYGGGDCPAKGAADCKAPTRLRGSHQRHQWLHPSVPLVRMQPSRAGVGDRRFRGGSPKGFRLWARACRNIAMGAGAVTPATASPADPRTTCPVARPSRMRPSAVRRAPSLTRTSTRAMVAVPSHDARVFINSRPVRLATLALVGSWALLMVATSVADVARGHRTSRSRPASTGKVSSRGSSCSERRVGGETSGDQASA
jgi:hypothetical protein